jgi:hypothetical protein
MAEEYDAMAVLDMDLTSYREPELVTDGNAYQLRLTKVPAVRVVNKVGIGPVEVADFTFSIEDSELANPKNVRHSVWFPSNGESQTDKQKSMGKLIKFAKAMGVEGLSSTGEFKAKFPELVGAVITATLSVKISKNPQYPNENQIKMIIS